MQLERLMADRLDRLAATADEDAIRKPSGDEEYSRSPRLGRKCGASSGEHPPECWSHRSVERAARLFIPIAAGQQGDVAQLVEHLLCKQGVGGSSPLVSTNH